MTNLKKRSLIYTGTYSNVYFDNSWIEYLWCMTQPLLILFDYLKTVPDDTVQLVLNRLPFVTQGSLILELSIAPYTITHFLYLFSIFYSTDTTAAGDPPPPSHWTVSTETSAWKWPPPLLTKEVNSVQLWSRTAVETMYSTTGIIFEVTTLTSTAVAGCLFTSPSQSNMAPIGSTWRHGRCEAAPNSHPGLPVRRSTSATARSLG